MTVVSRILAKVMRFAKFVNRSFQIVKEKKDDFISHLLDILSFIFLCQSYFLLHFLHFFLGQFFGLLGSFGKYIRNFMVVNLLVFFPERFQKTDDYFGKV